MKHEIIGWVYKNANMEEIFRWYNYSGLSELKVNTEVYEYRGVKNSWDTKDYPPKKVKITVEDL